MNVTTKQLDNLVALLQSRFNSAFTQKYPNVRVPVISYTMGRKYARIVRTCSGRYVHGFVDLENGDLLKAASWKSPARNFARGNIHNAVDLDALTERSFG